MEVSFCTNCEPERDCTVVVVTKSKCHISIATISEAARNLAQKLGINSTEVSLNPDKICELT